MELRKAYIECERRKAEKRIEIEDTKLKGKIITPEQHKEIIGEIQRSLEQRILHLI